VCSLKAGKKIESVFIINDCAGATMATIDRTAFEIIKLGAKMCSDNYPETFGQLFFINAPAFFFFIYSIIKPWIDERTRSKIMVYKSDYKEKLFEFCDEDQIPKL